LSDDEKMAIQNNFEKAYNQEVECNQKLLKNPSNLSISPKIQRRRSSKEATKNYGKS